VNTVHALDAGRIRAFGVDYCTHPDLSEVWGEPTGSRPYPTDGVHRTRGHVRTNYSYTMQDLPGGDGGQWGLSHIVCVNDRQEPCEVRLIWERHGTTVAIFDYDHLTKHLTLIVNNEGGEWGEVAIDAQGSVRRARGYIGGSEVWDKSEIMAWIDRNAQADFKHYVMTFVPRDP
jgi:hypothetical protein